MSIPAIFSDPPTHARILQREAARGLAYEAEDIRQDIARALADLERALFQLKEAGVDVKEAAATLHDEISNRDADLCKTIDAAGEWYGPLDLSELRGLAQNEGLNRAAAHQQEK